MGDLKLGRFLLILGLLIGGCLWFRWPHLNTLVWGSDEGIHLSAAYLVAQGKQPYREVSFSQGPLFLETVRWPLAWWPAQGNELTAVRSTLLVFAILLLVAVALIGRALQGDLAGWAAALTLVAMPSFFYFGRAVMADLPAVAVGLWAAWAALHYFRSGKWRWLGASALLLGISLAFKFLTVYALGWIGLLLLYRLWVCEQGRSWRWKVGATLFGGSLLVVGTLGTLLTIYALYDLPVVLRSIFGMRMAMRTAFGGWVAKNLDEVAEFWRYHAPLIILAGYGLWGQLRNRERTLLLGSWLALILLSLRIQNPLYHQHLQLLLPIVALLAGLGSATLWSQGSRLFRPPWSWQALGATLVGGLLVGWLISFTVTSYRVPNRYTELSATGLREGQESVVTLLENFTAPNDCVVTDDLNLAFISRRLPPPGLTDLSTARLVTASFTDGELIELTKQAGCQGVAALTNRFIELTPAFAQWSQATLLGRWQGEEEATLWLAQPLLNPQPLLPRHAVLGDQLLLHGADLSHDRQTHHLFVSLYWEARQPLTTDYKIFVHLRDGNNNTVVSGDHFPYDNRVPTTVWPVGRTVKETIRLDLPADLELAGYQLKVGIYDPASQARLPVLDDASGENAVGIELVGL